MNRVSALSVKVENHQFIERSDYSAGSQILAFTSFLAVADYEGQKVPLTANVIHTA
jgi:hypothetical protein